MADKKSFEQMGADERKSAGVNKKGEPRKRGNVQFAGASRRKTFTCNHVGKGKFCHRCKAVQDGALVEVGTKLQPAGVSHRQIADHLAKELGYEKLPDGRYKGSFAGAPVTTSKGVLIRTWLDSNPTKTLDQLKAKLAK